MMRLPCTSKYHKLPGSRLRVWPPVCVSVRASMRACVCTCVRACVSDTMHVICCENVLLTSKILGKKITHIDTNICNRTAQGPFSHLFTSTFVSKVKRLYTLFDMRISRKWWQIWQTLLLPSNMKCSFDLHIYIWSCPILNVKVRSCTFRSWNVNIL